MTTAEQEKLLGNESFKKGNFEQALVHYNKAIELEPENAILYSNRSATYNELGKFWSSLEDARRTNKLSPKFVKGHLRCGAACANLGRFGEALEAFREALNIEPDNKSCLFFIIGYLCVQHFQQAQCGFEEASQKFFYDTDQIYRYAIRNPEIRDILCNSEIRALVQEAVQNPKVLLQMTNDQRIQVEKLIKIGILRFS
uniref:Uncharacterized protein n=1 Tax=Romanomermis culicivorax TaxID=13658 RepID=A0A915IV98_ROMCU